jgi:hypothetical protein
MEKLTLSVLFIALAFAVYALIICAIQFAWNQAVVPTFGAPSLSFWQTWGCMMIVGFVGSCFRAATKSK